MKIIARWELDNISSIFNLKSYFQMTAISSLVLLLLFTIVIPFILKWQPYLQYKEMETSLYQQKPWFPLRTGYIPGFKAWVQQGAGKPPHASHSVLTHWHQQDLAGFSASTFMLWTSSLIIERFRSGLKTDWMLGHFETWHIILRAVQKT